MARLYTVGPISSRSAATPGHPDAISGGTNPTLDPVGTISHVTSPVRSPHGRYAASTTAAGSFWRIAGIGGINGRSYYARAYFRFADVTPASAVALLSFQTSGAGLIARIQMMTDGRLRLDNGTLGVGGDSIVLDVDTWYRIELRVKLDSSPTSSNGLTAAHAINAFDESDLIWAPTSSVVDLGSTSPDRCQIGWNGPAPDAAVYWCDAGLNDSTGSDQNSWLDRGCVGFLVPATPDVSRSAGWLRGAGSNANLYIPLSTDPPPGLGSAASTNLTEIENIVSSTADPGESFVMSCAAYDTAPSVHAGGAGISSGDTITLLQGVARIANSTTTARSMGLRVESNPGPGTEATFSTGTTAGGTDPTGWTSFRTAPLYNPSPTIATKPTLRLRKNAASTNVLAADFAGILVEFQQPLAALMALSAASVTASGSLALKATTLVPLASVSSAATTSAAFTAATKIALAATSATASASTTVVVPVSLQLNAASVSASASAALITALRMPLDAASVTAGGTLTIVSIFTVDLQSSDAAATTSAALAADTYVALNPVDLVASGTLGVTGPVQFFPTSDAVAGGSLEITTPVIFEDLESNAVLTGVVTVETEAEIFPGEVSASMSVSGVVTTTAKPIMSSANSVLTTSSPSPIVRPLLSLATTASTTTAMFLIAVPRFVLTTTIETSVVLAVLVPKPPVRAGEMFSGATIPAQVPKGVTLLVVEITRGATIFGDEKLSDAVAVEDFAGAVVDEKISGATEEPIQLLV